MGDLDRARQLFVEALSLNHKAGNIYGALGTMEQLGDLAKIQGQLHRQVDFCRRGLQMAQNWSDQRGRGRGTLQAASGLHRALGTALYQWNDLAGAAPHIQRAVELNDLGDTWGRLLPYKMLAYLRQAHGDYQAAYDLLSQACAIRDALTVHQVNTSLEPGLDQLRILLSRAEPRMAHLLTDASERIEALVLRPDDDVDFTSPEGYVRESEYSDLARILIALGRAAEAVPLLERLLDAALAMDRQGDAIRYLILQALAYHALGDTDPAQAALGHALKLAEPEGYVRVFVDEGEPMAELLREAATRSTSPDYVARLLAMFADPTMDVQVTRDEGLALAGGPPSMVEPLTGRELEVLRLMSGGLKHREVADQLVISLNTVRHHARNIYGKLGVHSRTQAIAKARELKLL
jgi:LuxR family maltose regulon positive regulatory protein